MSQSKFLFGQEAVRAFKRCSRCRYSIKTDESVCAQCGRTLKILNDQIEKQGQDAVKAAIQRLGGKGEKNQIVTELRKVDASPCLDKLVTDRLNKMHKRYEVEKVQDKKTGVWYYQLVQ